VLTVKIKQNSDTIQSNTTLTDDDELSVALDASTTYFIDMMLIGNSGGTPGFKMAFVYTGTLSFAALTEGAVNASLPSTSGAGDALGPCCHLGGSNLTTPTVRSRGGSGTANTTEGGHIRGVIVTNASGNLKFQWAQVTSTASNTTALAGSYIAYAKQSDIDGVLIAKAGDTSRTNNTLTADAELQFATGANKKYIVELFALLDGNSTTPDYKDAFHDANVSLSAAHVTSVNIKASGTFMGASDSDTQGQWVASSFVTTPTGGILSTQTTTQKSARHILAAHQMGGSGGTLTYEWAQNTTNGTATILRQPSWLLYQEIEQ
jgi:hypothetical protein